MVADGQVTAGNQVLKPNVHKLRRINNKVIAGFAGRITDPFMGLRDTPFSFQVRRQMLSPSLTIWRSR